MNGWQQVRKEELEKEGARLSNAERDLVEVANFAMDAIGSSHKGNPGVHGAKFQAKYVALRNLVRERVDYLRDAYSRESVEAEKSAHPVAAAEVSEPEEPATPHG